MRSILAVEASLGAVLLTGSDKCQQSVNINTTHLKEGRGNPWAGHKTVTLFLTLLSNDLLLSTVGNFGFTLPTGSKIKWKPL